MPYAKEQLAEQFNALSREIRDLRQGVRPQIRMDHNTSGQFTNSGGQL